MKNKILVYMIFILMLVSNFIFFNTANADTIYNIGFESAIVTQDDYNESIARFQEGSGIFTGDDSPVYSGSRSWRWRSRGGSENAVDYINLSTGVNFVSWYFNPIESDLSDEISIEFKNSDGDTIIKIDIHDGEQKWYNNDHADSDTVILGSTDSAEWNYFSVQINSTDSLYFSTEDADDNVLHVEDTPNLIKDNYNITQIVFYNDETGNENINFDNMQFGVVDVEYNDENLCGLTSVSINTPNVQLGDFVTYEITVTGEIGSQFWFQIKNETNKYVYKYYKHLTSETEHYNLTVYFPYEFGNGTYRLDVKDYFFIPCDGIEDMFYTTYFAVSWYEGLNESAIIEQYGNNEESFIEFYGYNEPCRYSMNQQPVVVWYFNSSDFSGYDYAYVTIWSRNDNGSSTAYFLDYHDSFTTDLMNQVIVKSLGRRFQENDDYIIRVYKSNNESIIDPYNPVVMSHMIYVCQYDNQQDWDNDGIPNWQDDDADGDGILDDWVDENNNGINDNDEIDILPTLEQPLGSIVGFIIVGFSLLMPFIIAGSIGKQVGSNIQVPPLVYGFFGALGIGVSTIMGLFPAWIIFFIVAIGVIIVALTYLLNLRQQGVV